MVTPVLTKQQQKKALSGKKGSQKSLRNVLSLPYETYWPLVDEKEEDLPSILERVLLPLKKEKKSIPFQQLKKMSSEERKEKRKSLNEELFPEKKKLRGNLVIGVNCVTRALEKDTVSCVMVDRDVVPKDLIRHIVVMCANQKVPVIVLPSLKKLTSISLCIPSIALGVKKGVADTEGSHFYELCQKIKELSAKFPVGEPSTFFHCSTEEESSEEENNEKSVDPPQIRPPSSIYKYRTSTKERAFIPGEAPALQKAVQDDFLSFNSANDDMETDSEDLMENETEPVGISHTLLQRKPQYVLPVIKRLQPNPDKKRKDKNKKKCNS